MCFEFRGCIHYDRIVYLLLLFVLYIHKIIQEFCMVFACAFWNARDTAHSLNWSVSLNFAFNQHVHTFSAFVLIATTNDVYVIRSVVDGKKTFAHLK